MPLAPPDPPSNVGWRDCAVCGAKVLDDRRCPRCHNRPKRLDLVLGVAQYSLRSNILLASYYADSSFTSSVLTTSGTNSKVDATAAQLKDGSDATADTFTVSGDGISVGSALKEVRFRLGSPTMYVQSIESISKVTVNVRAEVTGSLGSLAVIYAFYGTQYMPDNAVQDDYLSSPSGALAWVSYDYSNDTVTLAPWDLSRIVSQTWGFDHLLVTLDVNDSNTIRITEYRVDLTGTGRG